jgi:hypothetical protein
MLKTMFLKLVSGEIRKETFKLKNTNISMIKLGKNIGKWEKSKLILRISTVNYLLINI